MKNQTAKVVLLVYDYSTTVTLTKDVKLYTQFSKENDEKNQEIIY